MMTNPHDQLLAALAGSPALLAVAKATLIALVGLGAARLARRSRASVRHLILALTFAALMVLPAAALVPGATIEAPVATPGAAPAARSAAPESRADRSPDRMAAAAPARSPQPRSAAWSRPTLAASLTAAWAAVSALLLASLALSLSRLRRVRRSAAPWPRGRARLDALAAGAGIDGRRLDLVLHRTDEGPCTWGVIRHAIVLPRDAAGWSDEVLDRTLVHELEHIRRADWLVHVAARVVCCAYWFHPLVWMAWRRLRLAGERACDDAVLRSADDIDYAQQLLALAGQRAGARRRPVLAMAGRSDLAERIAAVLERGQLRGRAGARAVTAACAGAAVLVMALGPLKVAGAAVCHMPRLVHSRAAQAARHDPPRQDATCQPARQGATGHDSAGQGAACQGSTPVAAAPQAAAPQAAAPRDPARAAALGGALLEAARRGDLAAVDALLDAGADANATVPGDGSPLIVASCEGRAEVVRRLLDRGASPGLAVRGDGNPLIVAARDGRLDIVALLLDRGASIDQIVPDDENALIQASAAGQLKVVELLVRRGADVNARAWAALSSGKPPRGEWRTPLGQARRGGHTAVIDLLRGAGARE
ncbi:MAG TPA: M56 family metallopeptidase [Kofleriaceae bacterium]|nr:M56 family metallopeptidase [Kofleriaceae bacterium]